MSGPAAKRKHGATLPRNRFHHSKGKSSVFEHRPLLDVELKVSARVRMMRGGDDIGMSGSIAIQRREHRNAVRIPPRQVRRQELADKGAAADERQAIAHAL